MKAINLSDKEFKVTTIRVFKKLRENYRQLNVNYNSIRREVETINKNQREGFL